MSPYTPQPTDESQAHAERIFETLIWVLTTDSLPELLADEQMLDDLRDARPDLAQMSERELVDRVKTLFDTHFRHLFGQHLFTTYCSTVPVGIIQQVCDAVGRPDDFLRVMAGVGDVESAAPSYAMWKLSRLAPDSDEFKVAFADFINEYGARGPNEWETRSPTWETEPELALVAIEQMRRTPDSGLQSIIRPHARRSASESVPRLPRCWRAIPRRTASSWRRCKRRRSSWRVASGPRRTRSGSRTSAGSRCANSAGGTSSTASATT